MQNRNDDELLARLVNAYRQGNNHYGMLDENTKLILNAFQGQDMEQIFYGLCKAKGVEPSTILNLFKK